MRSTFRSFLLLTVLVGLVSSFGCASTPPEPSEWQPFSGKVVWVSTSRGFWGIEARQLGKINPIELPLALQRDGLRIEGELRLRPDIISAKRWGTTADVRNLQQTP